MAPKTLFLCGALLNLLPSALAVPVVGHEVPAPVLLERGNITVDPPKNITPIITELGDMTREELEELLQEVEGDIEDGIDTLVSRTAAALAPRATGTDGALLTFIDGGILPGNDATCPYFSINGPFTTIHAFLGSSNVRGILATSFTGNTTEMHAGDTVSDAGEFTFKDNERITKLSVAFADGDPAVGGFTFETDAGNKYEALAQKFTDGTITPVYQDLDVGSGIIARFTGTQCETGIFGSFGIDFLDELDSISITNMDYSGFTDNIMPSGPGTQMSVGSQVLDNRNSSEKQTITLTTTDAVTAQRTVTTQIRAQVGGSVSIEAEAGVPLISSGKTTAEANWQIESLSVSAEPLSVLPLYFLSVGSSSRASTDRSPYHTSSLPPIWKTPSLPAPAPLPSSVRPASSAQQRHSSPSSR